MSGALSLERSRGSDRTARLRATGAELVGEVVQCEDAYRLCYMRGPASIIVALADELSRKTVRNSRQSALNAREQQLLS